MSHSDPLSVAVCMDASVMGESGGGVEDLEHNTLALLLVLSSGLRTMYWLLVLVAHTEEVGESCIAM